MVKLEAYGSIKDGKLILANKKRFAADLSQFKDCQIEVIVKKRNRRTSPQNRYLWGVVYKELEIRMNDLGNEVDSDTVHEFCKERFAPVNIVGPGGEVIGVKGASTAEMGKEEFGLYVDKIIRFAAEVLEITIPLPGQVLQFEFEFE